MANISIEKKSSLPVITHRISGRARVRICGFAKQLLSDGFLKVLWYWEGRLCFGLNMTNILFFIRTLHNL